jgi:hypothetical protein
MKLNKTNLNKLIKWTSSKFNEYTKDEVIDRVFRLKPMEEFWCRCGSYSEGAYNGGVIYRFKRTIDKLIVGINDNVEVLEVKWND